MNVYEAIKWINTHQLQAVDPIEVTNRAVNALQTCILTYNYFDTEMYLYNLHRCVASWVKYHYDAIYNIQVNNHDKESFEDKHIVTILATMQTLAPKIVTPYSQHFHWYVIYLHHLVNCFVGSYKVFVEMLPYIYELRKLRVIDNKCYNCLILHKAMSQNISISDFPKFVRNEAKKSFLYVGKPAYEFGC